MVSSYDYLQSLGDGDLGQCHIDQALGYPDRAAAFQAHTAAAPKYSKRKPGQTNHHPRVKSVGAKSAYHDGKGRLRTTVSEKKKVLRYFRVKRALTRKAWRQ
jgi:hypothetical protein